MYKIGKKCNLSDLKVNQKGIILALNIKNIKVKRHLLDMGLTRGTCVEIKKIAPLGDPIDIAVRGYELAIRKADLKQIEVEVLK